MADPLRTSLKSVEEMGLFEEIGLPEPEDMIPAPVEVIRNLGIPTPADIALNMRADLDRAVAQVRQQLDRAVGKRPPLPHEVIGLTLGEPMGAAQSSR